MKILVCGAGNIGSLDAAKLRDAGNHISIMTHLRPKPAKRLTLIEAGQPIERIVEQLNAVDEHVSSVPPAMGRYLSKQLETKVATGFELCNALPPIALQQFAVQGDHNLEAV